MESQESDLCGEDEMQLLLGEPQVNTILQNFDWTHVAVPDPLGDSATGELPSRVPWAGPHLFEAKVDLSGNHKKQYVVSFKLNKLFVDLGKVVPFQIKWDGTPGLFVRALLMFSQADHMKNPVRRCMIHKDQDHASNADYNHADHVVAADNPCAQYCVDALSQRHSVVVPVHLPQGTDHALINYKFMCKTSCTGGLNRGLTDLIFTLEDSQGSVLGRSLIGVKICSCPKRDKEKEELGSGEETGKIKKNKPKKEDKPNGTAEPMAKRIKLEGGGLDPSTSFMVTAVNPQIAYLLKEHIRKWDDVKQVEWSASSPLVNISEDFAVVPQPYM